MIRAKRVKMLISKIGQLPKTTPPHVTPMNRFFNKKVLKPFYRFKNYSQPEKHNIAYTFLCIMAIIWFLGLDKPPLASTRDKHAALSHSHVIQYCLQYNGFHKRCGSRMKKTISSCLLWILQSILRIILPNCSKLVKLVFNPIY